MENKSIQSDTVQTDTVKPEAKTASDAQPAEVKSSDLKSPELKILLEAGVQFGHEISKWNPKMKKYIFGSKNKIHIIDVKMTMEKLEEALKFISEKAQKGNILFVATKRQARDIVKEVAVDSGSYFIVNRWPGGLLTNMKMVKKSFQNLRKIEEEFESGVANRTKYEVTLMKKEWDRMNKLYGGVKTMERYPEAIIIVDSNYEQGCVEEAKKAKIPVVALTDTNCDPDAVDYPVPANDDAIKSITLILNSFGKAIKAANAGKGVKHMLKDYSSIQVQIIKKEEEAEAEKELKITEEPRIPIVKEVSMPVSGSRQKGKKGILEKVKEMEQEKSEIKKLGKDKSAIPVKKVIKAKVTKTAKVVTKKESKVKSVKTKTVKKAKTVKKINKKEINARMQIRQ